MGWNSYANKADYLRSEIPEDSRPSEKELSHLPYDLQFYLKYFDENITYHHYSLKHDTNDFIHTTFINAALRNDALLHAIVGFSAFQHTLSNPEGKIQHFLFYYNKAVSLLLASLKRGHRHTVGTLLTILQLATIEVSPTTFFRANRRLEKSLK